MEEFFQVGYIKATHGLCGELKVLPTSDQPKRFETLSSVLIEKKAQRIRQEIEGVRYFKEFVLLKFKGLDTIEAVETFVKCPIVIPRSEAMELSDGEYFISDLIGLSVVTEEGRELGTLFDVLKTGANDVYVLKDSAGKERMIPAISDCIRLVDLANKTMTVHLLAGLEELW